MLPLPATTHTSSSLLVSSTDPITTMAQLDQGVVEGYQADQTIETAGSSPPPPASPTKNPSSPAVPLSKRLFHAFVHKPTLSRTWEKKSFMDEGKKSAPAVMGGGASLHDLDGCLGSPPAKSEYRCSRSRPMSLYASPAEIAAFKPLPLMLDDERNVQGHTQMVLAITPT
ncbi:hypothetical protein I312_103407 [Cryptococcus bacillisporus CA1280]|uniref:uncharacterized protein n=1 Tax=Cryptococcus bacillisporus CA1280 TaxID=1296109 RepID=UPI003368B272